MNENDYHQMSPLGLTFEENNIKTENSNNNLNNEKNFDKIIIPYSFKKKNYLISDNEIEGYENKEFVLNTLYAYNLLKIFKIDSPYSPSCFERILFFFPVLLIIIGIAFGLIYLIIIFLFNPFIILISYQILKGVINIIRSIKHTLYEKMKKSAMNKKLEETNKSNYCKEHNIKWNLGVSGYWLEVEKIKKIVIK